MFERFTDRARRVLVLAQEEARLLDHDFIGTEHLLLGLIREEMGVAALALKSRGITLEAAREKVQDEIGPFATSFSGSPPFTPRAKKVLELALREALQLGHSYIGTEHLLLGLIREGEGVGVAVLVALGTDPSSLRQETLKLMTGGQGAERSIQDAYIGHQPPSASEGWVAPAWDRPSEGTLPAVIGVGAIVLQNDLVAVAIDCLEVYPNGFTIGLVMRVDPRRVPEMLKMLRPFGQSRWPDVGVGFADGRIAIRVPRIGVAPILPKDQQGVPTEPIVSMVGGGGGPGGWRAWVWVFPLPSEGPVNISIAFQAAGWGENTLTVDGAAIREAAERATVLWI